MEAVQETNKLNEAEVDIYFAELRQRLRVGAECYGDKSFDKTNERLAQEIQEELLDVAGWGFILWEKMQRLKAKMALLR